MSLPRRRSFIGLFCLTAFFVGSANAADKPIWVYIGTNSKASKGIYKSEFDPQTGKLGEPAVVAELRMPSFIAIHPNKKFLYAVSEIDMLDGKKGGGVVGFAIDPATGALTKLNQQSSVGAGPCHLIVDKAGKNVIVANYGGGSCACLPIDADGKLKPASDFHQHAGKVALKRQGGPHGHSANVSPDGKFVFVADLGLDQIKVYKLDADNGKLIPNDPPFYSTAAGAGPRHFAFHPNGKMAFIVNEIGMTLESMDYDAEKGVLTKKQVISTLPAGESQTADYKFSTAEVVVHPSGKFVYNSNRTHDTIAAYSLDDKGTMTSVGHQGDQVKIPRNFNIDPSGKWMLVANQNGASIVIFEIDQTTGMLSKVKSSVKVPSPCCVKFYTP